MAYTFTRTGAQIEGIHNTVDDLPNIVSNENLISNPSFEIAGSVTNPPDATSRNYNAGDELFQGMFAVSALTGVTYINGEANGLGQIYTDVYKSEKQKLSTSNYTASIAGSNGSPVESGVSFVDNGDYWRVTFDMNNTFSVKFEQGSVATGHSVSADRMKVFNSVTDMITGTLTVGNVCSTGGTQWRVNGTSSATRGFIDLGSGLGAFPIGDLFVDDFGGKGDSDGTTGNGTDNTTPFKDAADLAVSSGSWVAFSGGKYRFGGLPYNFTGVNSCLYMRGAACQQMDTNPQGSSIYIDGAGSFMEISPTFGNLTVNNLEVRAISYNIDRPLFDFVSGSCSHTFANVTFNSCERPITYRAGIYFQNAMLQNVTFRNSGTIHSETNSLISTLYILDNVNHEGGVPVNSAKVVCDLQGIRQIQGRNFLLEGSLPEDNLWTVLKLDNSDYDVSWAKAPVAKVDGFWSEWSGVNRPKFTLDQQSGFSIFNTTAAFFTDTRPCRLSDSAKIEVNGASFSSAVFDMEDAFVFQDRNCQAVLRNCAVRGKGYISDNITYDNCTYASSSVNEGQAKISNTASEKVLSFDGGYFNDGLYNFGRTAGMNDTPTVHATYGRAYKFTPTVSFFFYTTAKDNGQFRDGDDFIAVVRLKLPIFTSGSILIQGIKNPITALAGLASFDSSFSGQVVEFVAPFKIDADGAQPGLSFSPSGLSGLSGDIEIYTWELYRGGKFPNGFGRQYKSSIMTKGTSAPTIGTWATGDNVSTNNGATGFWCSAGGSPGTWTAY